MHFFDLINISKEDYESNNYSLDSINKFNEKIQEELTQQSCSVICILGESGSGKSYIFQNLIQSFSNIEAKSILGNEQEKKFYCAVRGVLIKKDSTNGQQHNIILLDCNFNFDSDYKQFSLQKQIYSSIQSISSITIYTTTQVDSEDVNNDILQAKPQYDLDMKKTCLVINKLTKNEIQELIQLESYTYLKNQFHNVFYLIQKSNSSVIKSCSKFSLLINYIQEQLNIQQPQADSQITKATSLLQEEIIKTVLKLQGQEKLVLASLAEIEKVESQKHNIQEDNKSEPVNSKIRQFSLIQLNQSDQGNLEIKQNEQIIQFLQSDYKDKKCIVTSFLGLKGSGKTTLAHEYINLIDPTISKEELQLMKKKRNNKQNGNCFMIEKNDIVHLVIDSEEPIGKCKGQDNLSEQIAFQLLMQSIIELVSDNSYFIKSLIRLTKNEQSIINGFKQLEKYIFGKINQKSFFIFNRLTDFEYQSLMKGDCKIKTIIDNYKQILYVRVNSELRGNSLDEDEKREHDSEKQSNENNQTNKNGFIEDMKTLFAIQGEEKKQTVNDFINKLKICLEQSKRVNQLINPLLNLLNPSIRSLKDDCIQQINHKIAPLKACSEVSQSLLNYLKQEIICDQKQSFLTQLKSSIGQLKEMQKLRYNLVHIYSSQFPQKNLLQELEKLDQQEVRKFEDFENVDFFNETDSLLSMKVNEQKNDLNNFLLFPIINQICIAVKNQYEKSKKASSLVDLVTKTYTFYQQKDYLTKKDAENIVETIINISKYVEKNKNSDIPEFEIEKKIYQILNLYDLGQKLFEDTKKIGLSKKTQEEIVTKLKDSAMDRSTFHKFLQQDSQDSESKIDTPKIQLYDEQQLKITSNKKEIEQLWFSLLSIQILNKSFILERICTPLLIKKLEQNQLKLSEYYKEVYEKIK